MISVHIITTGGTIDKKYSRAGELIIGRAMAPTLIAAARVNLEVSFEAVCRKDSLDLSREDREEIHARVEATNTNKIVITHGTDTMVTTGMTLREVANKTVILTGAMQPARMRDSDAASNLGLALAASSRRGLHRNEWAGYTNRSCSEAYGSWRFSGYRSA